MAGITGWLEWELKQPLAHNGLGRLANCFPSLSVKWNDKLEFAANAEARQSGLTFSTERKEDDICSTILSRQVPTATFGPSNAENLLGNTCSRKSTSPSAKRFQGV